MSFFNPFVATIESDNYPLARTLRTGFLQKLADTYFVFAGSFFFDKLEKKHVGLFDYATLMLPLCLNILTVWGLENAKHSTLARVVAAVTFVPSLITTAVRYLTAALFTLVAAPVVGIVHGISAIKAHALKAKVKNINLTNLDDYEENLGTFLNNRKESLNDIGCEISGTYSAVKLSLYGNMSGSIPTCACCANGKHGYKATLNLYERKDRKIFDAMLRLNFGKITEKLEQEDINVGKFKYKPSETKVHREIIPKTPRF